MCGIAHKRFCFIDWREYPMGRVSVWIDAPLSSDFPGGFVRQSVRQRTDAPGVKV